MKLSDIFIQLTELGYTPTLSGDVNDKYTYMELDGYYIDNRIIDKGFRITRDDTFISVFNGEDVIGFFKPKTHTKKGVR